MQLESESDSNIKLDIFSVKLNWVESTITTFQNMNAEVFYYSSDQSFTLVDKLQGWILEVGWHSSYIVKETCQNNVDKWEKWLVQIQKTPMSLLLDFA